MYMPTYLFEGELFVQMVRYFYTDAEALTYGESYGDKVVIMKRMDYEDSLATGYYWLIISE